MIFDSDVYCRAALYPRFEYEGLFSEEALLRLTKQSDDKTWAMSLGNRQLLKAELDAHNYGCQAAAAANLRTSAQRGEKGHVHYLGFYETTYGTMRSAPVDHYVPVVRYVPSEGDAHYHVELWEKKGSIPPELPQKERSRLRREDRLAFVAYIALTMRGPWRHVCTVDDDIRGFLEGLALPPYPRSVIAT